MITEQSEEGATIAALMIQMNAFLDQKTVEQLTGLSHMEIYRMRVEGKFPQMQTIRGRRKGYRVREVQSWLDDPEKWLPVQQ
jgi:predicted DNA-binding transcriptional regulator AlpA